MNWVSDKRWSDRFLPEVKRILGEHLIGAAPEEEDQRHNTDLIVLRLEAVRVACRIRKHDYFTRYPHEFTIRAGRPSGVETELTKIIRGWGNYFFYGFSDQQQSRLQAWLLGDLNEFRLWLWRQQTSGQCKWTKRTNTDGSSTFYAFDTRMMPDSFFVARHPLSRAA